MFVIVVLLMLSRCGLFPIDKSPPICFHHPVKLKGSGWFRNRGKCFEFDHLWNSGDKIWNKLNVAREHTSDAPPRHWYYSRPVQNVQGYTKAEVFLYHFGQHLRRIYPHLRVLNIYTPHPFLPYAQTIKAEVGEWTHLKDKTALRDETSAVNINF